MQATLIAAKRRCADLSLKETSKRVGIPLTMLWKFERGLKPLPARRQQRLERVVELKLRAAGLSVVSL